MGNVRKIVKTNNEEGWDMGHSEPFYYPGELEAQLEKGYKAHELSRFTIEELQDEVWRRTFEPMNTALAKLKATVDKYNGYSPEKPF